jgi:hypothetical protein
VVHRLISIERKQVKRLECRLASPLLPASAILPETRMEPTDLTIEILLREDRALRDGVDDHERRLSAVERRTG